MKIKSISSKETLLLRQKILRAGQAVESCQFENDNHKSTQHLGAFFNDKLVGILTLLRNKSDIFNNKSQIQLRGMAVDDEFQKQGVGRALLKEALKFKKTNELFWCNARVSAADFYLNNAFVKVSEVFEIKDVGPHVIMKYSGNEKK